MLEQPWIMLDLQASAVQEFVSSPFSVAIVAMLIPIVAVFGYYVFEAFKHRNEVELKREMVERGMSAEEIERVINAGRGKESKESDEVK